MCIGVGEQFPGLLVDCRAVRIDPQVLGFDVVSREMEITDSLCRHLQHELVRVVAMIDAVDNDIVDVEHQVAIRFLEDGIHKIRLGHRGICGRVIGNVFQRNTLLENILHPPYAFGDIADSLFREGDRHQVVKLAIVAAVAQVFGVHADVVFGHERLDIANELLVERCGPADGQRQAVDEERVALREPAELLAERAAHVNPVFRRDLHEVDLGGRIRHQLVGNRATQAEAGAADGIL